MQKEFEELKKKMENKQEQNFNSTKTPQQLTSHKVEDEEEPEQYDDEIVDETPKNLDEGIEDYYGEDEEVGKGDAHADADADDGFDMDYSQTHLDDFLKSQSTRGLNSQQLVQSFLSTYNKTKKKQELKQTQPSNVLPIDENIEEDEDISNRNEEDIDLSKVSANDDGYGSTEQKPAKDQLNLDYFDVSTKEGFKDLMRF